MMQSGAEAVAITVAPVNDAPVAEDDVGYATPFGVPLAITAVALFANDSDGDISQTRKGQISFEDGRLAETGTCAPFAAGT